MITKRGKVNVAKTMLRLTGIQNINQKVTGTLYGHPKHIDLVVQLSRMRVMRHPQYYHGCAIKLTTFSSWFFCISG